MGHAALNAIAGRRRYLLWPVAAGLAGMASLLLLYFGIVSWAESPRHALDLFSADRLIVMPLVVGFGIQSALYVTLKKRLFLPVDDIGPGGRLTGASGGISTAAMVACCAHHVTDVLPLLGLTAAATFLAEYRLAFMLAGLATTIVGIGLMARLLWRERRRAAGHWRPAPESA